MALQVIINPVASSIGIEILEAYVKVTAVSLVSTVGSISVFDTIETINVTLSVYANKAARDTFGVLPIEVRKHSFVIDSDFDTTPLKEWVYNKLKGRSEYGRALDV